MLRYVIKRLLLAVLALLAIFFISYILLRLAPGDPTRSSVFGGDDLRSAVSNAEKSDFARNEALRRKLHLDKSPVMGFCYWLEALILHGDLGTSATVEPGRPVTELIMERLPVTLKLNLMAVLLTYMLAIPIGVGAAVWPDSWFDRLSTIGVFLLYSLPVMWVGLLLQAFFCEGGRFPVLPLKGLAPENAQWSTWQALGEALKYYLLPVICLAYAGFAGLSRYTRTSMLEALHQDFIRTARAKGLGRGRVIWVHGFRNALITLITLFAGLLPGLVAGSIIIEYIFNLPGMGTLSLLALTSRDYPLAMALFAFAGVLTLGGVFISDMLYMAADPRIKLAE